MEAKDIKLEKNILEDINTIWDEYAQYDVLMEYVNTFLHDRGKRDSAFYAKVFDSIYKNYSVVCPEAEIYYAEKYINSIQKFLDKIETCRQQKL
jgi:hypothetical protein